MTTQTIPDDVAAKVTELGHADLAPDSDSYVPAWRCTACKAALMFADLSWQGWAVDFRCSDVVGIRRAVS